MGVTKNFYVDIAWSQIAIICWANAGILSVVLLAQRRQMTLERIWPRVYLFQSSLSVVLSAHVVITVDGHDKIFWCRHSMIPDSNHLLDQRWHFFGSFVDPTSTNDVSPMSFCSSGQLNCQPLVRCWSNARSPTSPAYANVNILHTYNIFYNSENVNNAD